MIEMTLEIMEDGTELTKLVIGEYEEYVEEKKFALFLDGEEEMVITARGDK